MVLNISLCFKNFKCRKWWYELKTLEISQIPEKCTKEFSLDVRSYEKFHELLYFPDLFGFFIRSLVLKQIILRSLYHYFRWLITVRREIIINYFSREQSGLFLCQYNNVHISLKSKL